MKQFVTYVDGALLIILLTITLLIPLVGWMWP